MSFKLGFPQFIGDPYSYNVPVSNSAAYQTKFGEIRGLNKVSLIQNGFFVADLLLDYDADGRPIFTNPNYTDNNIIVSNLSVRFAEKVNLTDNLYYAYIETPYGDAVYDADLTSVPPRPVGRESVELIGHLKYGFQEILEKETCEVRWYKKQLNIMISHDYYDKLAGAGWCPIEFLDDAADYTVNFDKLTVRKD
jgi:hypothetical protein